VLSGWLLLTLVLKIIDE